MRQHTPASGAEELIAKVATAHHAAIRRWQTVQCEVESQETVNGQKLTRSCRLWVDGDNIRCQETSSGDGLRYEGLCESGVVLQLALPIEGMTSSKAANANRSVGRDPFFSCNPPALLLYGFPRFPSSVAPFAEFLAQRHTALTADNVKSDGRDVVRVAMSIPTPAKVPSTWDFEVYFDPAVNYLVRKRVMRTNGRDDGRRECEITSFQEPQPGVFFPTESKAVAYRLGKVVSTTTTKVKDLKLNVPISKDVMRLRIPAGAKVMDRISGKTYTQGASGGADGPVRPFAKFESLNAVVTSPGDPPPTPWMERHTTPSSWNYWLIAAGLLAMLFIAGAVRRARRNAVG